ncbi:MAG TPA: TIGR03663 family protein [Anaerolineae bacterium]|nr:TIGR03663 family protein [Anaerolineae bacterium]
MGEKKVPRGKRALRTRGPSGPTVEATLYLLLLVVAAALRLYGLGARPLGTDEAQQAMAAWRFHQGELRSLEGYSPLLFYGNLLIFLLFGASDFWARLVPALFGVALVGLPYFLRRWLGFGLSSAEGRAGALAAAALLAISPSALFLSRSLEGETAVAACALVLLAALFGYLEERRPRHLYWGAGALGLMLTAGPGAYTILLLLITFFLILALATAAFPPQAGGTEGGPAEAWGRVVAAWRELRGDRGLLTRGAGLFGAVFLLASTGFLVNFGGLQASLDLFAAWVSQFRLPSGGYPWTYYLQILVLYEPLALVFGLVGAAYFLWQLRTAPREGTPFSPLSSLLSPLLVYWFVGSLILHTLAGGKRPAMILPILLPLILLAGAAIGRLLERVWEEAAWDREGLLLGLSLPISGFMLLQGTIYASFGETRFLLLALAALLSLIGLVGLFWTWTELSVALRGGGLTLLILLATLTVHASWHLNYLSHSQPRELLLPRATSPQVVRMVESLKRLSLDREGDPHTMAITAEAGLEPLLAWYLRDFGHVAFQTRIASPPGTPAVIVSAEGEPPPLGDYVGQRFRLQSFWSLAGLRGWDLARWFFYRQTSNPARSDDVILYVSR